MHYWDQMLRIGLEILLRIAISPHLVSRGTYIPKAGLLWPFKCPVNVHIKVIWRVEGEVCAIEATGGILRVEVALECSYPLKLFHPL